MNITRVRLINFTKFDNREFRFNGRGINAIIAPNGAGKSSVLIAIGIGIFNVYTGNLSKLVKFGKKQSELEVEFTVNNNLYVINRRFGKTSSTTLKINDKLVFSSLKEVYDHIYDVLEIRPEVYKNILYISSSNLIYPFVIEPSKRKILFDSILDLEKYEEYWSKLGDVKKKLEAGMSVLEKQRQFENGKLFGLDKSSSEINSLELRLKELNKLQQSYLENRAVIDRRSQLHKEIGLSEKELKQKTSKSDEIKVRINKLKNNRCFVCNSELDATSSRHLLNELSFEYNELGTDIYGLSTDIYDKKEELDSLISFDFKDYSRDISLIEAKIELLKQQLASSGEVKSKITEIDGEIKIISGKLNNLNYYRDKIRKMPQLIVENVTNRISREASIILTDLMDDSVEVVFDSTYQTTVRFEDRELSFDQLSEGQKVMVAISIRLAIISQLTDIGIAILDEPTINLSEENRLRLAEKISKLNFNQAFVITHDNSFSNYIDNTIRI